MIDLSGQTALVTGASRGIGRAIALRLAEAGADVAINFLTSQSAAVEVANEVQRCGRRAATIKADVSERDDVVAMVDFVGTHFGRLDIIVSNAASGGFRSLGEVQIQHFDAAMHVNVLPLVWLAQAGLPLLKKGEARSKVIGLSSHGSRLALPAYGAIGASKAALESVVRQLAYEHGGEGINFNAVLAGLVETDSTNRLPDAAAMFAAVQDRMLTGPRPLKPVDVADAVLFLASPLSDLVQGQTLVVDGGVSVRG